MKPIKIAQIGAGHDHAPMVFHSLCNNPDYFEVIGAAEINPNRTESFLNAVPMYTVEELLAMPELEAVTVECEEEYATEVAQRFAERGIAVHLDKPGSANLASFEKLIETLRANKCAFQLGYMYRHHPLVKRAFELAESGALGEIYSVEGHMSLAYDDSKCAWLEKFPGGMMYFLGCHMIDLVMRLQGVPEKVIPLNKCSGMRPNHAEECGFAVLQYKNGTSFVKSGCDEIGGFGRRQLVVCGSKGTVEIRPMENYPCGNNHTIQSVAKVTLIKDDEPKWRTVTEEWDSGLFDRYDEMTRTFARRVRGECADPYDYDYELALFRLVMACCGVTE